MTRRNKHRQTPAIESLENRQVLSTAAPSGELQYALELVNLARTNPAQAADRITANLSQSTRDTLEYFGVDIEKEKRDIANSQRRQPLAWSNELASAAGAHSRDMAEKGFQSHTGSDGSSPDDRSSRAGYTDQIRAAENAYAYSESIDQAMQAFLLDWGVSDKGHRRNLLEPDNGGDDSFKEVGIGVADSRRMGFGKVVTQKLGVRRNQPAQLVGVAYNDRDGNRFYSIGEGEGGVTIEVTDASGKVNRVSTAAAGGYQIALTPGTYRVRAFSGDREFQNRQVTVGRQNIKLDVVTSNGSTPINRGTPTPAPVRIASTPRTATPRNVPAPVVVSRPPTVITNEGATVGPKTSVVGSRDGFAWNTWRAVPRV